MTITLIDLHKAVKVKERVLDTNGELVCYKYTFGVTFGFEVTADPFHLPPVIHYIVKTFTGEILTVNSLDVIPVNERSN